MLLGRSVAYKTPRAVSDRLSSCLVCNECTITHLWKVFVKLAGECEAGEAVVLFTQERTTHPDNPKAQGSTTPDGQHSSTFREDCPATFRTIAWQQLRIISTEAGSTDDEQYVTFRATFRVVNQKGQRQKGNVLQMLHERSRFWREGGEWLYVGGDVEVTAEPR